MQDSCFQGSSPTVPASMPSTDDDTAKLLDLLARVRADAGDLKRTNGNGDGTATEDRSRTRSSWAERNWQRAGWAAGRGSGRGIKCPRSPKLIRQSNDLR